MVKSFFDPKWMDLGILGVYGRWQGVNWVWAEWFTIYHAIFSIAIPITLVELAYPRKRNLRWVSNKKLIGLAILLMGVTAFGYFFLTDFYPPLPHYCFFIAIVGFLLILAWKTPSKIGKGKLQSLTPTKSFVVGFVAVLALFLLFGAGPYIIVEPLILMIIGMGLVSILFLFLKRYNWNKDMTYQKFALIAGALVFLISLTPFQEFDKNRPDNAQGMLIVGIVAIIMLLMLRKKLKRKIF